MKNIEDFKSYFSKKYDEIVQDTIAEYLVGEVAQKYHLHEDPDSFVGSDDYYDVDLGCDLVDLVIEDDSPETLLFHACYQVVYDEIYCNPKIMNDVGQCYKDCGVHGYVLIDFIGYVDDEFDTLHPVKESICSISEENKPEFRKRFTNSIVYNHSLLPRLRTPEQLEFATEEMLKRYYPNFSGKSTNVDPQTLAKSMGLRLVLVPYLPDLIEGIIYFENGTYTTTAPDANVWNSFLDENDVLVPDKLAQYEAKAGTIVLAESSSDRRNNTLAHECCHWFLHRKPYLLQKLLGEEPPKISCRQGTMNGNANGAYIELREWQASNLSPRVLLANRSVHEEILRRVARKKRAGDDRILPDLIREAIEDFSAESPLSRGGILVQLQKKFRGLDGILPCPEYYYIRPYMYDSEKLAWNETFDISGDNYRFLYKSSEEFRFLIDSGLFVFAENHVCRVTGDSITVDGFEPMLTDETRLHMDRYCLKFRKPQKSHEKYENTQAGAFRFITKEVNEKLKLFDAGNAMPGDEVWEAALKGMKEINEVQSEMTENIKHDLPILVEWSDKTQYRITEDAQLDKHTLPDLLKGKSKSMKLKTAIQLCIGMQLPYDLSKCLLKAAHLDLEASPLHLAYSWIIKHLTFEPIEEANKFLSARNLPLLGRA